MSPTIDESMTPGLIKNYLDKRDDFDLELYVLRSLNESGWVTEHSGSAGFASQTDGVFGSVTASVIYGHHRLLIFRRLRRAPRILAGRLRLAEAVLRDRQRLLILKKQSIGLTMFFGM